MSAAPLARARFAPESRAGSFPGRLDEGLDASAAKFHVAALAPHPSQRNTTPFSSVASAVQPHRASAAAAHGVEERRWGCR